MFAAALIPGLLAALGYLLAIAVLVRLQPAAGPAGERAGRGERLRSLAEIWPVALIFALVIGGIQAGWFTPTEGAAVGAFGTGVLAILHGGMRLPGLIDCIKGTAATSAMIFLVLLGAELYNAFLALTDLPLVAADMIGESGLAPLWILIAILALYFVLGCVMDSLSMILLTIPIFFPIVSHLDFGLTRTRPPSGSAFWP